MPSQGAMLGWWPVTVTGSAVVSVGGVDVKEFGLQDEV